MFINTLAHYIPSTIITNQYFEKINGLSNDWIIERTGIISRHKNRKR